MVYSYIFNGDLMIWSCSSVSKLQISLNDRFKVSCNFDHFINDEEII